MKKTIPVTRTAAKRPQRGGFLIGLIVGLLVGLALALGVALYVTKVPVPFMNKVPQRTAEQDAAELEKNKNWDPNSPLYGKNPARPQAVPVPASAPADPSATQPPVTSATPSVPATGGDATAAATPHSRSASAPTSTRDPAAILANRPAADPSATVAAGATADPFRYFVQAGAYSQTDDAEQQRARLAMMGFVARVSEREQSGRTVFRVRLGPYDKKEDADNAKDRLSGASIESTLVRVQR